ncbi:hypothetical protein EJB05_54447, partial [Eragrostis curvula]
MVLDNDDLLREILLRLIFPTTLVRAAAVCKRWLRHASDPAFLRRFRNLHPPRLLGLYVQTGLLGYPRFVPTPHPPAELAAAIRRAGSILDDASLGVTAVTDCRNGRVLVELNNNKNRGDAAVLSPLHAAGGAAAVLPPLPLATRSNICTKRLTAVDGVVCAADRRWNLLSLTTRVTQGFHELRDDGTWHNLASLKFPSGTLSTVLISRPFHGKLYLMASASAIATLPSEFSRLHYLSIITLPDGVECMPKGKVKPWVDDSGLYLVHVKELQLRVWLRVMESDQWLLQDTICLHEVCAKLGVADGLSAATAVNVREVGHCAELVLLQLGVHVLYIHIRSRNVENVYTVKLEKPWIRLTPFVMIWPPIFPVVKEVKMALKTNNRPRFASRCLIL